MLLDLDTVIFVGFLAINLAVGLFHSRGIKSTAEYAIGNRNFSTGTIISTTVATCIGAGIFSAAITESYRQGLYFIIPAVLGDSLSLFITGYFLIPRMGEFFGTLSVAEAMGKLYGKYVRIITAISGGLLAMGAVALQFKVASSVLQIFFGISGFYALILSAAIVIMYSSFGGIKSVTFTDILQFLTFCTIIPIICSIIWQSNETSSTDALRLLSHNPLFDFKQVLGVDNPKLSSFLLLLLIFILPALDPTFFQRVSMSNGIAQAQRSFISSGAIVALVILTTCWIGVLLFLNNPSLEPDNLLGYIINTYTYTGLKGLTAACIMSIIMSTADSYINSATVLIAHDIIEPLGNRLIKPENKLLLLRIVAVCIGCFGLMLAVNTGGGLLQLLVKTLSFYMPIVSVPLLLAILGFRSSSKVVITGMASGSLAVILCYLLGIYEDGEATVGMLANLTTFIIVHWLLGSPQGTKSIEHEATLKNLGQQRKHNYFKLFSAIKNFDLIQLSRHNYSKHEHCDFIIGILAIATIFASSYTLPKVLLVAKNPMLNFIYYTNLLCAFVFITYPLWSPFLRKESYIDLFKMIAIPYTLIFVPMLLVIVSNFKGFQLIIFLINITTFVLLTRWQLALCTLALFSYLSALLYSGFERDLDIESYHYSGETLYFGATYILLFISTAIIAFLKPKQEAQELSEEMVDHLSHQLEDSNRQITELSTLKQTFLMNLQHETNTPITGVYSMSQALGDCYDKLTDEERKKAIATITSSSERLISYANNLIDTSKLMSSACSLKIRSVDLSSLLEEVLRKCKKLYISKEAEEDREFEVSIEPALKATCDDYYIRKSFENLIINSIQYCKKGKISISLATEGDKIKFIVKDSGIGIPNDELTKIFDPFVTSSKTLTPAGGRGVGLTLVKAAAEIHKGTIMASSSAEGGSIFTLTFPVKHREA